MPAAIVTFAFTISRNHPHSPAALDSVSMGPGTIRLPRLGACGAPWLHAGALALLAAFLFVPAQAFAQSVDSDTGTARTHVAILAPGSIAKTADMNFGLIAQSANAGTIVLDPTPTPTCTATNGLIRTGPCKAAAFSVYGLRQGNARRVRLNGPASGTVTLVGPGGATMLMTDIKLDGGPDMTLTTGGGNANLGRYNINTANGIATFRLGGTLHVGAVQPPGLYQGTLTITVVAFN